MENEIWVDIEGFEGFYKISSFGRLKSVRRIIKKGNGALVIFKSIILKKSIRKGYYFLGLTKNKKRINANIHRLVAKAFIPNPENKPQVNHKDGNKLNNFYLNLEWCTEKENTEHAIQNKLFSLPPKGEKNGMSKLTAKNVAEIRKTKKFKGVRQFLADKFKVTKKHISRIRSYERWKK